MSISLVSIIIPYYKKKDTINRSVDSVINQTHTNWELIIVDDNGIEPLEINLQWENYNISYLYNEKNLGAAKTRQRGQDIAKGDYIAFLDADDWWDSLFLEKCVHRLEIEKDCDGVYVKSLVCFADGASALRRYNNLSLSRIRETIIQYARPWQTSAIVWRKTSCGNWGDLKTNEDAWYEISSSKFNTLIPIDYVGNFFDRTNEFTLSTYYGLKYSIISQQELFIFIFKNYFTHVNIKYKVILVNRLIRGQLKIFEYCPEQSRIMGNKIFTLSSILFWMRNSPGLLKLIHKILQKTIFKINF
jgi:glycosyltransferase involved in cell wall biosynthesis